MDKLLRFFLLIRKLGILTKSRYHDTRDYLILNTAKISK